MKAILEIPEKEITFEFENLTIDQYRMIGEKPSNDFIGTIEKYPIGKEITLITSNMPDDLKLKLDEIIKTYCNH